MRFQLSRTYHDRFSGVFCRKAYHISSEITFDPIQKDNTMTQYSIFVPQPLDLTGDMAGPWMPCITALENGRTAVVWTEDGNEAIWLNLLDSSGVPEGDPIRVSDVGEDGNRPSVALLENGNIMVTFTGLLSTAGAAIQVQIFSSDGTAIGERRTLFSDSDHTSVAPETIGLSGGGTATVFGNLGLDGSYYGVFLQRSDADGAPIGKVQRVNQTTDSFQSGGQLVALENGGFVVTWHSRGVDGSLYAVMMRSYDADGEPLTNETCVNQFTSRSQRAPDITVLADGRFIISWESNSQDGSGNGVYARIYNENGTAAGNEFRINATTVSDQDGSAITALHNGGFIVAWRHEIRGSVYELRCQEFDADGNRVGDEIILSSGPQDVSTGVELVTGDDGVVRAIWLNGNLGDPAYSLYTVALGLRAEGTQDPDLITGSAVGDLLLGLGGADTLIGGAGSDDIDGGVGADSIDGGDGNDTLQGGTAFDTINGDAGDDSIVGGIGSDTVHGGAGNDSLYSNTGRDLVTGGEGNDYISAGDGDDTVLAGAGNDTVLGRSGRDSIDGDGGNDLLTGAQGIDTINGGAGDDSIMGGTGEDILNGDTGNDSLWGNEGRDLVRGGVGNDSLSGGSGWDTLEGEAGEDTLLGNIGSDSLVGGGGDDLLLGGSGDDTLIGGEGDDTLQGNQGIDLINGGLGDDELRGGTLSDEFVFNTGHGHDRITDFETAQDEIYLDATLVNSAQTGADVIAEFGEIISGTAVLDFGSSSITFLNLSDFTDVADSIFIVT